MATDNITLKRITGATTLSNKSLVSILNNSGADLSITITVAGSSDSITLDNGQSVTMQSSVGFSLPDLDIAKVGATMNVDLMFS